MLQNFVSSPWQSLENPSPVFDLGRSRLFQTPSKPPMTQFLLNSTQNHSNLDNSLKRQRMFSSSSLERSGNISKNKDKSTDRFIPQVKISSCYYSLLLTEQKQISSKKDKNQFSSSDSQTTEIGQEETDNSQTSYYQFNSEQSAYTQSEDPYAELLRNNVIKQLNDSQNRQTTSPISLFAESNKNSCSTSLNNKITGGETNFSRKQPKVLNFKMNIHRKNQLIQESDDIVFNSEPIENRKISNKPYKILDAPNLSGDFYTNVLDWTRSNLVVVALNNQIYTWSPIKHDVNTLLSNCQPDYAQPNIVSLSGNRDGSLLAAADETGYVKIFDIEKSKVMYEFEGHTERIGAITWNDNLLTTASKDYKIKIRDIRSKQNLSVLNFHKEQVCGIKWSEDGIHLASGGNDNKVCVYNHKMNKLTSVFQSHNGAVKALAWSPHKQNMLVSGGGNKDQTLKFWNIHTNTLIKSIHTGSQVCNMVFSQTHNEIVTTHGFQLNQISIWRADNYSQIATLYGHTERVLYLAQSPDSEDIVTGSADETLRFWKVFNQKKKRQQSQDQSKLDPIFSSLR